MTGILPGPRCDVRGASVERHGSTLHESHRPRRRHPDPAELQLATRTLWNDFKTANAFGAIRADQGIAIPAVLHIGQNPARGTKVGEEPYDISGVSVTGA